VLGRVYAQRARPVQQPRTFPLRSVGARHLRLSETRGYAVPRFGDTRQGSPRAGALHWAACVDRLVLDTVDPHAAGTVRSPRAARLFQPATRAVCRRGVPGKTPA
jgi:hypothetical protein